jgi:hypothetical protein
MARTIASWSNVSLIAVAMCAGAMQFTRIPRRASSIAIDLLRWITAAFDAR